MIKRIIGESSLKCRFPVSTLRHSVGPGDSRNQRFNVTEVTPEQVSRHAWTSTGLVCDFWSGGAWNSSVGIT